MFIPPRAVISLDERSERALRPPARLNQVRFTASGDRIPDRRVPNVAHTYQKIMRAIASPVMTATDVATSPGIMNEWFST